jgi:hypothetical protein
VPRKFRFSERQRNEHNLALAIQQDERGNEILCGLTLEETKECLVADNQFNPVGTWDDARQARYRELIEKHWAERKRLLKARQ